MGPKRVQTRRYRADSTNSLTRWKGQPEGVIVAPPKRIPHMARTSPAEFLRQVRQETSRVTWPTRKELTQTTLMVFLMAVTVAVFFFLVDEALGYFVRFVLGIGA